MGCLIRRGIYGKKAILLTLGMIFISIGILAFAEVILENSETSESRIKEFGETERHYQLDSSVSKSIHRMMQRTMGSVSEFGIYKGNISFNTTFLALNFTNESEIVHQLDIYANRLGNHSFVNFNGNRSLFGQSEGIMTKITPTYVDSSRFYLDFNDSLFIEFGAYPFNLVYFNGFNPENTKSVNLTFKGGPNYEVDQFIEIEPSCGIGEDCINVSIYFYSDGDLSGSYEEYMFKKEYTGELVSTKLMNFNVSYSKLDNRTIAINWWNLTLAEYPGKTTEGFAILFPDVTNGETGNAYDFYYQYEKSGVIKEDLELEIQVIMKGEALNYIGGFESQEIFDINLPYLDTYSTNRRVRYID